MQTYAHACGFSEGAVVSQMAHLNSDLKVGGSRSGLSRGVVSLDKNLYSTFSLPLPPAMD